MQTPYTDNAILQKVIEENPETWERLRMFQVEILGLKAISGLTDEEIELAMSMEEDDEL